MNIFFVNRAKSLTLTVACTLHSLHICNIIQHIDTRTRAHTHAHTENQTRLQAVSLYFITLCMRAYARYVCVFVKDL